MGKAPVELPDPQELSSSPPGANADDLLSQMAGAEIDRLLADADLAEEPVSPPEPFHPIEDPAHDAPPAAVVPSATKPTPDPFDDPSASSTADALRSPTDEILDAFATAEVPEAPADDAVLASDIIDVAGDGSAITDTPPTDPAMDRAALAFEPGQSTASAANELSRLDDAAAAGEDDAITRPAKQPRLASAPPQQAMSARPAVEPPAAKPPLRVDPEELSEDDDAPPSAAKLLAEELDSPSLVRILSESPNPQDLLNDAGASAPLLLKPLVWLNAPFASLQPKTRDLLGKVGVWTLLHAAAVLAYVVIFRK